MDAYIEEVFESENVRSPTKKLHKNITNKIWRDRLEQNHELTMTTPIVIAT